MQEDVLALDCSAFCLRIDTHHVVAHQVGLFAVCMTPPGLRRVRKRDERDPSMAKPKP